MKKRRIGHIFMARTALAITLLAWIAVDLELLKSLYTQVTGTIIWIELAEQIVLAGIVNILISGSVVYLITQVGYSRRKSAHRLKEREELEQIYESMQLPSLTILVPSYREEPEVVRRTLLSAALVEYPAKRVVLLIDDPPQADKTEDLKLLQDVQQLCVDLNALLEGQASFYAAAEQAFQARQAAGSRDIGDEMARLEYLYHEAAKWFDEQAGYENQNDHAAKFFRRQILRKPAEAHRNRALMLRKQRFEKISQVTLTQVSREYRRLATMFKTNLRSFERKKYLNLSHEPNKAMNLNSYISLIGNRWVTAPTADKKGAYLQPADAEGRGIDVPDADYLITLDADSLLLPDYVLKLVHFMEQPAAKHIAVVQTPYSAFPGALEPIENIAGATTDMQYRIHQGFTEHNATFWVGANALLRMKALKGIATIHEKNGLIFKKFIQDRTVIEDTESSIDLIQRGWRLHNYPERLAYSATPSDFGSLLIQRRRWANGGLIIFPKLVRYLMRGPASEGKFMEAFLRTHYLTSLAGTNFALLLFLVYGFYYSTVSPWLLAAILPLFLIVALSLKGMGYGYSDLFRVIALNLLLIPVNLSGAIRSIRQIITGKRAAFGRTPKVASRTAVPAGIVIAEFTLALYSLIMTVINYRNGYWIVALFCLLNGLFFSYAIYRFMGIKNSISDVSLAAARSWHALNVRVLVAAKAEFMVLFTRGSNVRKRPTPLT